VGSERENFIRECDIPMKRFEQRNVTFGLGRPLIFGRNWEFCLRKMIQVRVIESVMMREAIGPVVGGRPRLL